LIDDFQVNNSALNLSGLGRPSIAANVNGGFAVGWQDFNENNAWVLEIPRISVQMFSPTATPIGNLNLFRGESRYLVNWGNDYLEPNPDIVFHPNGSLLVSVEHQGWFWLGTSENFSTEVGYGIVSSTGEMLDASGEGMEGNISWLYSSNTTMEENPRITVAPAGNFFITTQGVGYDTEKTAILIQQYDATGATSGNLFTPHTTDPGPNFNHGFPDVATNGDKLVVAWQDSRQDANWDITAQYYNVSGAIGNNFKVNTDAAGAINAWPSVDMNTSGFCVFVWADTRNGANGEIFGQRYNAEIQPVGENFQVSNSQGFIMDRPEIAITNDGSFMVVWTDSLLNLSGLGAYRVRGRTYNSDGLAIAEPFILPNQDIASGLANIGTDGVNYYLTWLDNRKAETYLNLYAKKISPGTTSSISSSPSVISRMILYDAYPNPFNSTTTIRYYIPEASQVQLKIYDILGKKIRTLVNDFKSTGEHTIKFDASELTSGIYLYQLSSSDGISITKKFLLSK